jgi:hypothetical protein
VEGEKLKGDAPRLPQAALKATKHARHRAGKPEKSLLIEAISWECGSANAAEIVAAADLISTWVKLGAPWPEEKSARPAILSNEAFDLEKRRAGHWAWQPISKPSFPEIQNKRWPAQPMDRFVLARLETDGLSPAPPADRRTLLRRLYFDLIGLPPARKRSSFVRDDSANAYEGRDVCWPLRI